MAEEDNSSCSSSSNSIAVLSCCGYAEGMAYKLCDDVLEKLRTNDPDITSINLPPSDDEMLNVHLLSLLLNKELCEKAGILIGSNTQLDSLYIDMGTIDGADENFEQYEHSENFDRFLLWVADNRSITRLHLGLCPDNSNAIEIMTPLFENNAITELSFNNCGSTHTKLLAKSLQRTNDWRTLKRFSVKGTRGQDAMNDYEVSTLIITFADHHCLEKLALEWTTIDGRSILALSDMLINSNCHLKELELEYNEFHDAYFSVFAMGILINNTLEKLNLKGSEYVSSEGWVNFFSILRPNKLSSISAQCLENIRASEVITEEGWTSFYNSTIPANMDTLQTLCLENNDIDDR